MRTQRGFAMRGGAVTLAAMSLVASACGDSSDSDKAAVVAPGDAAAGEELFFTPMAEVRLSDACSTCHSADGDQRGWGPLLEGISDQAAERVAGISAVDYLRESIVDTRAFPVEGWSLHMPENYADVLSEEQIDDLIAYMLTQ